MQEPQTLLEGQKGVFDLFILLVFGRERLMKVKQIIKPLSYMPCCGCSFQFCSLHTWESCRALQFSTW